MLFLLFVFFLVPFVAFLLLPTLIIFELEVLGATIVLTISILCVVDIIKRDIRSESKHSSQNTEEE